MCGDGRDEWRVLSGQGLLVELGFEDGADASVAAGVQRQGAATGGFHALVSVIAAQTHHAEASAIPLLGMRFARQDVAYRLAALRTDGASPSMRRLGVHARCFWCDLGRWAGSVVKPWRARLRA